MGKAALVLLQLGHATRLAHQALAVHEVAVAASLLRAKMGEGAGGGTFVRVKEDVRPHTNIKEAG